MQFNGFAGNENAKRLLSAFVDGGRFPHALLIEGPEGSGRRTMARLLAKAAVCMSSEEKPCGHCAACVKAESGNHPDITEAGGSSAARSFHIETVRKLRDTAYVLPNEAPVRVMILAGVQAMTEQAQNALLKILEEPPRHLLFLLTCENRSQLLSTIQSRTVCVSLGAVDTEAAAEVIQKKIPGIEAEKARSAADAFGGIIGQAIHGLEEGTFQQVMELTPAVALAVIAPSELELLQLTGKMEKDKELADGLLHSLGLLFRDAIACRFGEQSRMSFCSEIAEKLARTLTKSQLFALVEAVDSLQEARRYTVNHTLFLTLLCSRLRKAAGR